MGTGFDRAVEIINSLKGKIVVGVSGGMDSMCLMDLILKSSVDLASVTVVHVDHNLRQTSGRDRRFVEDFCRLNGINCKVFSENIALMSEQSGLSIETQARIYRHNVFRAEGGVLLLAHTASDQAETILMHIFRGCGLDGLVGMSEFDGKIVRPLINLYREDICTYMKLYNLAHVEDETNADLCYNRNFVRDMMGKIKLRYASADKHIVKLGQLAKISQPKLDFSLFSCENGVVGLCKSAFLLDEVNYYILHAFKLAGFTHNFEFKHVSIVKNLAHRPTNKKINLPNGFIAQTTPNKILIFKQV